jgi:hypothetical protein
MAGISDALTVAGTGLSAIGAVQSGNAQSSMYNYQAQVSRNNAAVSRLNAQDALAAGLYEESASKTKTGSIVNSAKAAQAANGIDVNIGTAVQVRDTTELVGAMDAAMIHYNANRKAFGLMAEAADLENQGQLLSMAAKNAKRSGQLGFATSIVSGASSLASRWSQYKQAGVGKS